MIRTILSLFSLFGFLIFITPVYAAITFQPLTNTPPPVGARMMVAPATQPPHIDGNPHDVCWKQRAASRVRFVKADGTGRPKAGSWLQVCYDQKNLYVMFYALRPKGHRNAIPADATGRDQSSLFKGDALQIFLQPGGKGSTFYQIAISPKGGVYDQSVTPDNGWMQDIHWNVRGLRVAGAARKGGYYIEAAIPFAALNTHAPKPGTFWRGNFCRAEHSITELTAWAPTGRSFASPSRFGTIVFTDRAPTASKSHAKTGHATVHGTLVRPDGQPAAYVLVKTAAGRTRSNAKGQFKLKNMPAGKQILALISPGYQQRVGRIAVQKGENIIAPITLTPIDAYRPAFGGPIGAGSVAWLKTSIGEPFDMKAAQAPTGNAIAKNLSLLAAPGQYVTRAVALYLNDDVKQPHAMIQWDRNGSSTISSTIRWVSRDLDRQYYLPRETAQWTWRFVWNRAPAALRKGHVRMLIVTIQLPENAAPGPRRGTLILRSGNHTVATLPLTLTVAPFHLAVPARRLGVYYYFQFDDWTGAELSDIRAHGGSLLVASQIAPKINMDKAGKITVDTSRVKQAIQLMQSHGFKPPYLVMIPIGRIDQLAAKYARTHGHTLPKGNARWPALAKLAIFHNLVQQTIDALKQVQTELHTGPLMLYWMDEVFNRDRLPRWLSLAKVIRPMTGNPIFVTMNNRAGTGKDIALADPYLDIRCYNGPALDKWLAKGHTWADLAAALKDSGDTGWTYYNDRGLEFSPEEQRLTCGYWLWRSPLMANVPWVYHRPRQGNSDFNTLDNARGDILMAGHDPNAAAGQHPIVSTLDWEAYRQGYNDLCYLATLKQAIEHAPANSAAAKKAQQWLSRLRHTMPQTVADQAKALTAKDYRQRRAQMAKMIESLDTP